ncbi:MAG TPA: hypothetical protein DEO60_08365 [Bacteroidales bacterium]|nr:hypothetical protein [Bacteroidales bacterium]
MMMFSLDVFGGNEPVGRQLTGFLVSNIPVFVLILVLAIAWKFEIIGGIIFVLLFFALGIFFNSFTGNSGSLIILIPILVAGAMFILHHFLSEKGRR